MTKACYCSSHLAHVLDPDLRQNTIKKCLKALKPHADKFEAIAISGYSMALIAPVIADAMGKSLIIVRKDEEERASWHEVEGQLVKSYIIIDDLISSGETMHRVEKKIGDYFYSGAKLYGIYLYDLEHSAYRNAESLKRHTGLTLLN